MPCFRAEYAAAARSRTVCSLEPAASAVPSPTENEQHDDDNDEKCGGVHVTLLWSNLYVWNTPFMSGTRQTLAKPFSGTMGETRILGAIGVPTQERPAAPASDKAE
jgi:hypothetical protein